MEVIALKESELEEWFDHLALVFETTGRPYFVRHWVNDPNASYSDIFVVHDPTTKKIISTVKVYIREFYFNGLIHKVGGIGEVSTNPEYRSKGLAKLILERTIKHMEEKEIYISALSASKARGYYQNLGWSVVPFYLTSHIISRNKITQGSIAPGYSIEAATFTNDQVQQFSSLHHFYSQNFNGPLSRSLSYFSKWIQNEISVCGGTALVLKHSLEAKDRDNVEEGFVCLASDKNSLIVKDFFVGEESWRRDRGKEALQQFLSFYLSKFSTIKEEEIEIKYPSAIFVGPLYDEGIQEIEKKESYLYRLLGTKSQEQGQFIQEMEGKEEHKFVFWDLDKF